MGDRSHKLVFLCGFMGVGKSTIGQLLAEQLKLEFMDLDFLIQAGAGKTIPQIFDAEGEVGFRQREARVLSNLPDQAAVVSLGGGTLNFEQNLKWILGVGTLIYLSATVSTLMARLKTSQEIRPLLHGLPEAEVQKKIRGLLAEREATYKKAALEIATDGKEPAHIAREIAAALMEISS